VRAHQSRTFGRSDAAPCGRESEPAPLGAYWALDAFDLLERLRSTAEGLSEAQASERLRRHGANLRREHRGASRLHLLIRQVRSPLLLLLVFAAAASVVMDEWLDAGIVGFIVVATIAIGYSKEYRAQSTADALRARLHPRVTVLRDRQQRTIPAESLVPGDVIVLAAGSIVPADGNSQSRLRAAIHRRNHGAKVGQQWIDSRPNLFDHRSTPGGAACSWTEGRSMGIFSSGSGESPHFIPSWQRDR
jgi:hypothetical protein